jgi:hypothetical protein
MQSVPWHGQEYFTSQYFHQQYLANSPHGGKYRQHSHFVRTIRAIPAYPIYLEQDAIVELTWNRIKTEGNPILDSFQPLFQAAGWNPLTLLNATAQIALTHHLEDELSKQISVAVNTASARQATTKAVKGLPTQIAAQMAEDYLRIGALFGTPVHIVQQEAAKQIEATTGINLRPLLLAAPAQQTIAPDDVMLEPTDLAKALGFPSGYALNRALETLGWQVKAISGGWEPTPAGAPYAAQHAWTAEHGAKSGYNWKWKHTATQDALIAAGLLQRSS